jgi:prepilin-type N-terminal cleavage/methylation domain-containing protein
VPYVQPPQVSPAATRRQGRTHPPGFTLAELMISIGVLGIGMTMAAALFPMGLRESQDSAKYAQATMMMENGLAVARAALRRAGTLLTPALSLFADEQSGLYVDTAQLVHFPNGLESKRGFTILARKIDADSDANTDEGYQVVVIPYIKSRGSGPLASTPAPARARLLTMTYTITDPNNANNVTSSIALSVGTPIVDSATGRYATVISCTGTAGVLDRPIPGGTPGTARPGWILSEVDPTPGAAVVPLSPAITIKGPDGKLNAAVMVTTVPRY